MDRKYRKRKSSEKESDTMLEGNISPQMRHKKSRIRAKQDDTDEEKCLKETSHEPFVTESGSETTDSYKKAKSKTKVKCTDSESKRRKVDKRLRSLENGEGKEDSKVAGVKTGKEENEFKKRKRSRDSEKQKKSVNLDLLSENVSANGHYHKVNEEGRDEVVSEIHESKKKKKKCENIVSSSTIQELNGKNFIDSVDENHKTKKEKKKEKRKEKKKEKEKKEERDKEEKKKRKAIEINTLSMDDQEAESLLETPNEEKIQKREEKRKKKEKKKKQDKVKENKSISEENSDDSIHPALLYLHQWKKDRDCWRFQKVRQIWLLQNMYNRQKVPDKDFKVLMKYLQGLKGAARHKTITDAEKLIENEETTNEDNICKDRLKQVVQQITEV